MRKTYMLTAVAILGSLNLTVFTGLPVLAQGQMAVAHGVLSSPKAPVDPLMSALTDSRTGFKSVTMPNGDALGPNIPGRMIVGSLRATPLSERIGYATLYILLLILSAAWAILGYREMNSILGKEFD